MSVKSIDSIFEDFRDLNVLVVGDVMIDAYIWGLANRISPEAPVPVVKTTEKEFRLGGAANVALNIRALGGNPLLGSVIGQDPEGSQLIERLDLREIDSSCIIKSDSRPTTIKTRVLSGYQHIVRIDSENEIPLNQEEEQELYELLESKLESVHVVVFEDYDKGTLTPSLISKVIKRANELNIPSVVDPKRKNFFSYKDATVFKPNLKELSEGLNLTSIPDTIPEIIEAATNLKENLQVDEIFLTLSEKGVLIKNKETELHIPAYVRTISDVSGAGDTVISIIALCRALNLSPAFTAELANLGGGLVCEHVGVVPVSKEDLLHEAKKYDIVKNL